MQLRTILSFFHFVFPAFLFLACDHPVNILEIKSESELVIYAFPTTADEYLLNVSLSRPTVGQLYPELVEALDEATVECTTISAAGSGQARADEVNFVHSETHFGMPVAIYRVKGKHHSGDKINICVKASALGKNYAATASSTIPSATPIEVMSVDTVNTDGVKVRFLLNVSLPTSDEGYYATRLTSVWNDPYFDNHDDDDRPHFNNIYYESYWQNPSSTRYEHLAIDPSLEPLINHYSDLNLDPWNEYYEKLYFFSNDDLHFSSQQSGEILHLQADASNRCDYIDVQFYTLSPEYYLMLRHINDQLSNEFAEVGLSQTFSTYSNVRGGLGCVAAYACSHYKYVPPVIESDGMYY